LDEYWKITNLNENITFIWGGGSHVSFT
jgi:hypothetical protein